MGAELLIIGRLYSTTEGYELFLKLLRVETGEVLSVTKAIIDKALGLEVSAGRVNTLSSSSQGERLVTEGFATVVAGEW